MYIEKQTESQIHIYCEMFYNTADILNVIAILKFKKDVAFTKHKLAMSWSCNVLKYYWLSLSRHICFSDDTSNTGLRVLRV